MVFDTRKVMAMITVIMMSDIKLGRYESASLVILFLLITYPRNIGTAMALKTMVSTSINAKLSGWI